MGCCVTYRRVQDWMIGFIASYTFTQLGTVVFLHTLHFTVRQEVFTSRNMATGFSQSHCHFKSRMNSFHSLTPLLSLFCNCQFRRLHSVQSQANIPAGCVPKLDSSLLTLSILPNTPLWPLYTESEGKNIYC
jgi:hypothetical protein